VTRKVRSIFISDVHLGTRACQAERLLEFLRQHDSEYLYLVGDIVDLWAMSRGIYWSPDQNTIVQKILRRARHGQHVMFIPGNHDEALREYDGVLFGEILVRNEFVHETADGRRFLLVHGDAYDQVTRYHRWLTVAGDVGYNVLVHANRWIGVVRRWMRRPGYWSLAGYAKNRVKKAVSFVFDFEDSVARAVRGRRLDGVICGHIHSAAIKEMPDLTYINCGDWVDSCTAIIETEDGQFELFDAMAQPATAETGDAPLAEVIPLPALPSKDDRRKNVIAFNLAPGSRPPRISGVRRL
jgi:UDP-2,3-diacylglucosamine pyrophosphatase LpxH